MRTLVAALLELRRCAAMKPSRIASASARCGDDSGSSNAICDGEAVERCAANSSASSPAAAGCVGVRLAPREQRAAQIGAVLARERRECEPAVDDSVAGRREPRVAAGTRESRPRSFAGSRGSRPRRSSQTSRSTSARTASAGRPTRNSAWPRTAAASRCTCSGSGLRQRAEHVERGLRPALAPTRAARAARCSSAAVQRSRRCALRRARRRASAVSP